MYIKSLSTLILAIVLMISCRKVNGPDSGGIIVGDASTEIEGDISGRLKFEDGPFVVIDDIHILPADTLVIDAGVYIYFEEGRRLTVEGLLIANGEKNKPVFFRTYNESYWLGISLLNSSQLSEFRYCIIQQVVQESGDVVTSGAVEVQNSNALFQNCIFQQNLTQSGGGLFINNSSAEIKNCIFRDNYADYFGGAFVLENSTSSVINNTIYNNTCYNFGGGIVLDDPLTTDIQNNIFYSNYSFTGDRHIAVTSGDSSNINLGYNFLDAGNLNPQFVSSGDLHLSAISPCINNGNPDSVYNDYDGTRNDQGAYGGPMGDW